jgi:hypothetical protein
MQKNALNGVIEDIAELLTKWVCDTFIFYFDIIINIILYFFKNTEDLLLFDVNIIIRNIF